MLCRECEFNKVFIPTEYFKQIIFLLKLKQADFPFGKDDLTIEQWLDMKLIEDKINEKAQKQIESKIKK